MSCEHLTVYMVLLISFCWVHPRLGEVMRTDEKDKKYTYKSIEHQGFVKVYVNHQIVNEKLWIVVYKLILGYVMVVFSNTTIPICFSSITYWTFKLM